MLVYEALVAKVLMIILLAGGPSFKTILNFQVFLTRGQQQEMCCYFLGTLPAQL